MSTYRGYDTPELLRGNQVRRGFQIDGRRAYRLKTPTGTPQRQRPPRTWYVETD